MADFQFKISPDRAPFTYCAWFELPFPLSVEVSEAFQGKYRSQNTEVKIEILSNVYKVLSGNNWQLGREIEEWASRVRSGASESPPLYGWVQEYITQDEIYNFVRGLESREETRYIHTEEIPSVVRVSALVPQELVPKVDFDIWDISPDRNFITEGVLPNLQVIIDAYRIAARPWMRYSILPVSEALVDEALIKFVDREGNVVSNITYGFDARSPKHKIRTILPDIQERFEDFLPEISELHIENQMASAYYLYRMRRWTEALIIASAVVDSLTRDLVNQIASSEIEADAILTAYGYRYQELFNKVFPAFGKPKLSESNKDLWDNFVNAKKNRGAKAHGANSSPFDSNQEKDTKHYLRAFHDVASWVCQQMGREWALDCFDEKGNKLEAFN